ncbi:unnamed protein product [Polarella glacialis]|uniref:Heme-binding-like protein n=1 Tax=Polarella glacialis TaxID=89957 RepID=A0A813H5L2_POLGL|nr:unnamed protein product [Polarella glacialis]
MLLSAQKAAAEHLSSALKPEEVSSKQPPAWKPAFRSLLLSRNEQTRGAALKELTQVFEEVSSSIVAEIETCAAAVDKWPLLARLGLLRPFFGYRSACASLYRTMVDHVLPEQAGSSIRVESRVENGTQILRYVLRSDGMEVDGGNEVQTEEARALLVLLRQLKGSTAWELQKAAAAASGGADSFDQWAARTPSLESPNYTVVFKGPTFEVREYAPYSVVQMGGAGVEKGAGGNVSFFALAGYIFGKKNERQEKMAMTTPVQMDRKSGAMSFIMPSKYWGEDALQNAPPPTADAGVRLESRKAETLAVSIFGGYAMAPAVARKTEELVSAVEEGSSGWEVVDSSSTRLMQYNDPFTVPWKRRNEVSIAVRRSDN